jgi:putative salt-induced outer membrane protein YdiY
MEGTMWFLWVALSALAADSKLETTVKDVEEVEEPQGDLTAELGGALAAGNSAAYSLNAGVSGGYKWKMNRISGSAAAMFGQSVVDADGDGILSVEERRSGYVTNQQQGVGFLRYDRFLTKKDSLYALSGALVDPFAGFASRTHQQLGYSRKIVTTETTLFVGEVGFDWAQENYVAGIDPGYQDVFALRFMTGLQHTFNEAVQLKSSVEVYPNVIEWEDVRVMNNTSVAAKLSDKLGFKTAYVLRFDNVPVPGFRKADHAVTASLVVTIL